MDYGLLIAQADHGPGMHGGLLPVILGTAIVGGVVVLVLRARRQARKGPDPDAERERSPKA